MTYETAKAHVECYARRVHCSYQRKGRPHVVIVTTGGKVMAETIRGYSEWPILYDNGLIGYDHPYQVAKYVKAMVRRAYRDLGRYVAKGAG